MAFIFALNVFVIAVKCVFWYFGRFNKTSISLSTAFYWGIFYHLGSLAIGSLLVALLWLIKIILHYIYKKVKEQTDKNTNFCCKCLVCFVSCFERIL